MTEVFEHPVTLRWRDTDALGHVNNAVFLMTYLEEGRDVFYNQFLGDPIYVVVRIEIDFRAEVRPDDRRVTVQIGVHLVGTTSLTTRETILRATGEGGRRGTRHHSAVGSRSRARPASAFQRRRSEPGSKPWLPWPASRCQAPAG